MCILRVLIKFAIVEKIMNIFYEHAGALRRFNTGIPVKRYQ